VFPAAVGRPQPGDRPLPPPPRLARRRGPPL